LKVRLNEIYFYFNNFSFDKTVCPCLTLVDFCILLSLPKTKSQWGEPLIFADDVGCGAVKDAVGNPQDTCIPAVAGASSVPGMDTTNTSTEFVIERRPGFLFDCVNMCIEEGSTNCILGPSTSTSALLRILAKRLDPLEGMVNHAPGVRVGYLDSQAIAELVSEVDPNTCRTALEYLVEEFPHKSQQELRGHLTAFGMSPTSQTKTPISFLSGGETFRFVLAKVMVEEPAVLCLEHPTSNLDVESVQALAHGLREWNGTLILVCHDANFLRSMKDVQCVVIVPEEGKVRRILPDEGMFGMDPYLKTIQFTPSSF
jgi:ABC-type Mn2+/Zn2+ transport system ATPase subunit